MLWFDRSQSLVRCEPWFLTGASSREQPWCLDAYFPAPRARETDHRHVLHGEQDGHYRLGRWASRTTQDLAGEPKSAGAGATNTVRNEAEIDHRRRWCADASSKKRQQLLCSRTTTRSQRRCRESTDLVHSVFSIECRTVKRRLPTNTTLRDPTKSPKDGCSTVVVRVHTARQRGPCARTLLDF